MSPIEEKSLSHTGTELVARDKNGQEVGSATISRRKGTVHIGYLGIKPEFRNQGWGSLLLRSAIDWAEKKGAATISGQLIPVPGYEKAVLNLLTTQGFTISSNGRVIKRLP